MLGYYLDTPKEKFTRVCAKCKEIFQESKVEDHHLIPKFLGGVDEDGRIFLCRGKETNDCHRKLHIFLGKKIKEFTLRWGEKKDGDTKTTAKP